MNALLLALSYLFGATPTSYWVGRAFHGIDLREHGSGNLGATNTFRVMGWKWAVPVMVVDVSKGFVPVWFFPQFVGGATGWAMAFGAAAIVGHMFSLWVGFKGGKGVATSAGVFLALAPWAVLVCLGVWIGLLFSTRMVAVGSIGAALALPLCVAFLPPGGSPGMVAFTAALGAFVIWAHRSNIRRILKGEESRFGRGKTREATGG